mgnify:CR=1 FL=1
MRKTILATILLIIAYSFVGCSSKSEDQNIVTESIQISETSIFNLTSTWKTEEGNEIYGLFQESYNPIGLHIDGGFNS